MGASPTPGRIRYSGLIWPGVLIVLGVIALLVNTNVITADRLYRLGDLWPVLADATGMDQILMNLCLNARDAMSEGGQLLLQTQNQVVEDAAEAERVKQLVTQKSELAAQFMARVPIVPVRVVVNWARITDLRAGYKVTEVHAEQEVPA